VRILVVDDEPDLIESVRLGFELQWREIELLEAGTGEAALDRVEHDHPDIVLLDIGLPDIDGFEVLRQIRAFSDVPVVMLTARGDETDRIVGLELGADDYIVKPFSPKELVARVRALFRRLDRERDAEAPLALGALEVDRTRHTVRLDGRAVHLTAKEFALLVALLEAGGRVLSRRKLLEDVWGYSYAEGTRTVDVHVRRLREKLPELAASILTVKSLGYRLASDPEP
jgi:DNA-binding response OmpR family regulator